MADLGTDAKFVRNPGLAWADMDGETVMLLLERSEYVGLSETGSRIWELLEAPTSVSELCDVLTAEYEVEIDQCRADAEAFLSGLLEMDLIRPG
jgi:hypothetical protein